MDAHAGTVSFASPTDEPYGCLHPAARYRGAFREHGEYWTSPALYCLAQRLASPADREQIRIKSRDLAHAAEMAASMARLPDADANAYAVLSHALRCAFEHNLELRAVLVATGDDIIEARGDDGMTGVGAAALGRALMETRAIVRQRANDPRAIQCRHQDADDLRAVCIHRLDAILPVHRRFTGTGADYQLWCPACVAALPAQPPLRTLCADCFEGYLAGDRLADVGTPAIRERATTLTFSHRVLRLFATAPATPPATRIDALALAPVPQQPHAWLLLDRAGQVHHIDTAHGVVAAAATLDLSTLDVSGPIDMIVAPRGALVAIAEAKGRNAIVVEPASGRVTHRVRRDDYHEDHCRFPLGFFELDGRLLLVHATEWNRLDVSDPHSGELLTARTSPAHVSGAPTPPHYLDYFHAGLVVSPDGARVLDNGWVWHPYGQIRVFHLARWVRQNPWESEDGPSVKELCGRSYFWDGPVAWLDATTIAVWGSGDDDETLTPAALIYDADTGALRNRFDGPARGLASVPPYLVAFDAEHGTSAWDPATGERLLHDGSFTPLAVHPTSHELVGRLDDGGLRVTTLA